MSQKPSERIKELYKEETTPNLGRVDKLTACLNSVIKYLDEQYEKDMNTPVSCEQMHPESAIYHPNGHTKRNF